MLPITPSPATRPTTLHEWTALMAALLTGAVGMLVAVGTANGQSLSIVAGEIRHGQHGRQDQVGLEIGTHAGPVDLYLEAAGRHGDVDDDNSGMPWLTLTAGRSVGPLRLYAGWYATPMDYGRWTPLAGPRLDVALGDRVSLHASHYWRRSGLVRMRMTEWTARTLFRIDWRIVR